MRNILLFFLYIGLSISSISAQFTAIPDTAFEQRLIQLGYDTGVVDGQVPTAFIQNISQLNLATSGPTINDLTGIEDFVGLTNLNCSFNELSSLTLNNHPNLTVLFCHRNNLTQLNLGNVTSLTQLNCAENDLSTIDVSNNPNLVYLNCIENNLSQIDVSNNISLSSLYLTKNQLQAVDISNNTALTSFLCGGNQLSTLDVRTNLNLTMLWCDANNLAEIDLRNQPNLIKFESQNNLPYLKICVLDAIAAQNEPQWRKDLSAVYLDICDLSTISGRIAIDANSNCLVEPSETGLTNQLIKFERVSDGFTRIASSYDNLGNYRTYLDTGVYNITVMPSSPYWQGCLAASQLTITSTNNSHTVNAALQAVVSCPLLEVDIAAPFIRRANGGSSYTVSYCNNGTVGVPNASVEVTLDPHLIYLSSSIPVASQQGAIFSYNLGPLGPGDCGSFDIAVIVDSLAIIGQTHCSEARITPDSICEPTWNGPNVEGYADCQNDTVFFHLENIGGAMTVAQDFTIIEDDIAMRMGSIQLGAGQSTIIAQVAKEKSTYRILVNQATGFPPLYGQSVFSTAVEGCHPDSSGNFYTQYFLMFQNDDASPFVAIDCQRSIAAYDPNDKQGQPLGYGMSHYIQQEDFLNYKIRFQNTGNDTAFNVLITDTLSSYLDYTKLQMGSSSHDYYWELENGNVLKVYFPNIKLVDSTTNVEGSQGYFNFKIDQMPSNPIGTVINNSAAIYFDYNPAIITNTTMHTVGEEYVTVQVDQVFSSSLEVNVAPNPFDYRTTITVSGAEYEELSIMLFDLSGRLVRQSTANSGNSIELLKGQLNTGMYIYKLLGDGRMISTGKVVVK